MYSAKFIAVLLKLYYYVLDCESRPTGYVNHTEILS